MSVAFVREQNRDIKRLEKVNPKPHRTATIIEYAQLEYDDFTTKPFCAVDSLILSQMAYMNFAGEVPAPGSGKSNITIQSLYKGEKFEEFTRRTYVPSNNRRLLAAVCANPRFRDIEINYYVEKTDDKLEMQFGAVTFFLPDGSIYVAFRGTDSSIVGWKEDFNMFYMDTIPGQLQAMEYLEYVMDRTEGLVIVGGHSKGGNLALYAASFAGKDYNDRIVKVYNHDGFGMTKTRIGRSDYIDMEDRTDTTVPQASIIGQIFTNGIYTVVASRGISIWQHDPFTWEIRDGYFVRKEKITGSAQGLIQAVYEVMETLSVQDRELFVDTVFEIIAVAGAQRFGDVITMTLKSHEKVMDALQAMDPVTREKVKSTTAGLVKLTLKNSFTPQESESGVIHDTLARLSGTKDRIVIGTAEMLETYWSRINMAEEDISPDEIYIQSKI